ncbi:MAG: TonB-dependent receptor [Bacteroidales bacterium]|nr:TonB-dependent receptor [Bacteroidales bacterium]
MNKVTRNIKRYIFLQRFLTILSLLLACFCLNVSGQNTLQGYIYDENKNPFTGANIVLNETKGTVSDGEGKFVFTNVTSAHFNVKVTAIGYKDVLINGKTDTIRNDFQIILSPSVQKLEEVQVNENVGEKIKKSESISIQLIEEEFLKKAKASSLMQTLNNIPGINSMDIGTGISKPMIRGMSYYRVVVAQNGIKQEGQQWSNHQGISIDQQAVSHVEIIKGPASLQYGSDAIGGVINILPPHVPISSGVSGEVSFTVKSNTKWLGSSANLSIRKGDIYSNIALTYNKYGDFLIPETDSFLLPAPVNAAEASHKVILGNQMYNTAGNEKAVSISTGLVKQWGNSYLEFNYYGTQNGFFDWQGIQNDSTKTLHEQNRRDVQLPSQEVNNYAIHHYTNRYFKNDKLEIGLGYQLNDSREFSYLTDRNGNRTEEYNYFRNKGNYELGLLLHTISGNVFYSVNRFKKQQIKFGVNTQYQIHRTDGYNHILPEYKRFSTGVFLTHKYNVTNKWILNNGARIDYTFFSMDESLNPDVEFGDSIFNPSFEKTYPSFAISSGVNYLPGRNTIIKVNIGKSFRIPSAYELGAYGLHRHEGRFEKGNVENEPEQAWQLDLGIEKKWKGLTLQISPFLNYFTNYLYLNPTPELRPEGQVYEYMQTNAMLTGSEVSVDIALRNKIIIISGLEYVYAVNLDLKSALPFTPPLNIQTEVSYVLKNTKIFTKNKAGVELLSAGPQNYTVPNELSTPGYNTINLQALTEINLGKQKINLMLKVRNLLNSSYYNHISFYRRMRIPEQGRDVQLFISFPINN